MSLFDFDYPNIWTALENRKKPIVLYGMGNAADRVLDEFAKRGITAAGVMASDDFVRYQVFRGFIVKKESDLERELGDFTVALCFGSSLPNVMRHIREVASRRELLVPNIPVVGDELMDRSYIEVNRADIQRAHDLLADDRSREVFKGVLHFYYTGRLRYLDDIESDKDEAFTGILRLDNDERYLDLGAYRGDTVDEFLRYTDGYEGITAVEPNPKNYSKLCSHIETMTDAIAINAGIADIKGVMRVSRKSGRMPTLGGDGIEIPVTTVDAIGGRPTYIKADIEGMESAMLKGAVRTLKVLKPKLNIAAYHRTGDFFSLVLQLRDINPDYRVYLRKHPYIPCWDLNIYAQ